MYPPQCIYLLPSVSTSCMQCGKYLLPKALVTHNSPFASKVPLHSLFLVCGIIAEVAEIQPNANGEPWSVRKKKKKYGTKSHYTVCLSKTIH